MLSIIICDNEDKELTELELMTLNIFENCVHIQKCNNYFKLQTLLFDEIREKVDIVLMNIKIGKEMGINLANQIQRIFPYVQIAFISDSPEYAKDIFKANPAYFLLKPVNKNDLQEAMNRMISQLNIKKHRIFIFETKREIFPLLIENIRYVESEKRVVHFHMLENRVESGYGKIDEIEERLPIQFLRCHQSYIVNMNYIFSFSANSIVLDNEMTIPISRAKFKNVKNILFNYMESEHEKTINVDGSLCN